MYDIIKSVIEEGTFNLSDMLKKIDIYYIKSELTDEQKEELVQLAQQKAKPENSYAPMQDQINQLFKLIEDLTSTVNANAKGMSAIKDAVEKIGGTVQTPTEEPEEEYPEWVKWDGVGTIPWMNGSKCNHNGDKWISHVDNNIWEPGATGVYDNIWEKVRS